MTGTEPTAEETLFHLTLLGRVDATDCDLLWAAGARDPDMVLTALVRNVSVADIVQYVRAGVVTTDEFLAHRKANISGPAAAALAAQGHTRPVDQRRWKRTNKIGRGNNSLYFQAGILDPADIDRLQAKQVWGDTAEGYVRAGVTSIDDMCWLRNAQVFGSDVEHYRRFGVTAINDMCRLGAHRINGFLVDTYRRGAPHRTVDDMIDLAKRGVTPDFAASYTALGITSHDDMEALARADIDPSFAEQYAREGASTAADILTRWNTPGDPLRRIFDDGFGASVIDDYVTMGVDRSDDMATLWFAQWDAWSVEHCTSRGWTVTQVLAVVNDNIGLAPVLWYFKAGHTGYDQFREEWDAGKWRRP